MRSNSVFFVFCFLCVTTCSSGISAHSLEINPTQQGLRSIQHEFLHDQHPVEDAIRNTRSAEKTVSNMDIREAIMQLINVIQAGNEKFEKFQFNQKKFNEKLSSKVDGLSSSLKNKIDHISTFLVRMKNKLDFVERTLKSSSVNEDGEVKSSKNDLQTIASESFDIISVLPTYINTIKDSCSDKIGNLEQSFKGLQSFLTFENDEDSIPENTSELISEETEVSETEENISLSKILKKSENKVLKVTEEIRNILSESNYITESLYEQVSGNYKDISKEMKGISNVEKVLLDTADGVLDTKRKLEFGVKQILFRIKEALDSQGQSMVDSLSERINQTADKIFDNQNQAMGNLTQKVEKEIGLVWRQMGIMYGQVSNSISILEKVKDQTETYVKNTGQNLGEMEGTVEGLTDSMVNVDTNLNYMLGQLSLVVKEFNQVKTGLTDAMSEMSGGNYEDIQPYENKSDSNGEI